VSLPDVRRITVAEVLGRIPGPDGRRWEVAFERGSLEVELYAPRGHDPQTPHTRDELYVVVQGSGTFVSDGTRTPFGPGDVLFVAAGRPHRFEDFGLDLQAWVVFYGPEGGEHERPARAGARSRGRARKGPKR
jgi:mannose-6-phosphate isomerase-like protein (cupin superfamily)